MWKRNLAIGIVVAACAAGFMAWDIKVAREAKRIGEYSNSNVAEVKAALARNPEDAAAHSSMAQIDELHGDPAGAAQEYRQLIALEPDNREAKLLFAANLARTNRRAEARPVFLDLARQDDGAGRAAQRWLKNHP